MTIVTVTPNPAVDVTYTVDALVPGGSHRVRDVVERAGGKGLNVARVLQALGEPVMSVAPLGGSGGELIRAELARAGLPLRAVPIAGSTRRTVAVTTAATSYAETAHASATLFNEPGPRLSSAECADLEREVAAALIDASVLVVSGSAPPGVPPELYANLVEAARRAGVAAIVDTSGPGLLAAADAGASLVKPNAEELREATGRRDVVAAADELVHRGAGRVVVSLGADGLLGIAPEGRWRVPGVPAVRGNPTGAGDAVVAVLAAGVTRGTPWPDALVRAAAIGAAAVLAPVAGAVDLAAFRRFLPDLAAEELLR
ncbi:MAG TPA: hexose kinase [Jiangellaceae bacterium]